MERHTFNKTTVGQFKQFLESRKIEDSTILTVVNEMALKGDSTAFDTEECFVTGAHITIDKDETRVGLIFGEEFK